MCMHTLEQRGGLCPCHGSGHSPATARLAGNLNTEVHWDGEECGAAGATVSFLFLVSLIFLLFPSFDFSIGSFRKCTVTAPSPLQVPLTTFHCFPSSPCCSVTSATSGNAGCHVCARGSLLAQLPSPHWGPGHDILLWLACSWHCETLISTTLSSLELQGSAVCIVASLPCSAASKFSFVNQSFICWDYCPSWWVTAFYCPLLSCIQPLSCFMLDSGCSLFRARTIFFLCVYKACNTRKLVQGQSS